MSWLGDIAKALKELVVVQERLEVLSKGVTKISDRTDTTRSEVVGMSHAMTTIANKNTALSEQLAGQNAKLDAALKELQLLREQFARLDGQWQLVSRLAPPKSLIPNGPEDPIALQR